MNRRGMIKLLGTSSAGFLIPTTDAISAARAYYVSGLGADANNGLTPETAFRTLQRAADLTLPGDTVYAMNGNYTNPYSNSDVLSINRSGAHGAFIIYRNYPDHQPRILVNANNWQGIRILASYIMIQGFEVAGNAANITYDYAYSQKHNLSNCATNANGIYSNGRNVGTLRNIIIRRNYVHHLPGGGIGAMASDYVTIADNKVHSCAWWGAYGCSGISVYTSRDVDKKTSIYKTVVRRNVCYDNENFIPTFSSGKIQDGNGIIIDDNKNAQQDGVPAYKGRTLVTNNLCYDNGGTGMHAYSSAHVDIINNTAYCNNRSSAVDAGEISAGDCTSVRLYNNVLSALSGKRCQDYWRNVDVHYDYNVYHNGSVVVQGPNDIFADPYFVKASINPADADFRLEVRSPAMNSGTLKLAPSDDLVRNPRRNYWGVDRGSYEHLA
jgi:hypothetical protein